MLPFNARFSGATEATALVALFTLIAGEDRSMLITELDMEGMGTTSLGLEVGLYRVGTAGTTGAGAVTPVPVDATSPAFTGTAFASYTTQPLKGALLHNMPINANGQRYFWRCNPNLNNAYGVPGGSVAAASVALFTIGTAVGTVTGRIGFNEI
jgi:hypothetical protein